MSGSNRRILYTLTLTVTLLWVGYNGWLLGLTQGPKRGAESEQNHPQRHSDPTTSAQGPVLSNAKIPDQGDLGCEKGKDERTSDLCAQWKAADAARDAAEYSYWTMWLGSVGTILLVLTFWETRKTSRAELRAYVSVEMAGLEFTLVDGKAFAHIRLKNGGQTPAYLCCHAGNVFVRTDEEAERDIMRSHHKTLGRAKPFTLHMNDPQGGTIYAHDPIMLKDLQDVVEGDKWLYVFGTVYYRDTFGIDRKTRICVKTDDLELPSTNDPTKWPRERPVPTRCEWLMAHFHNDST